MAKTSKEIGLLGEKIAEKFLKKKGYQILDKNYSSKFVSGPLQGEIDIISKKEDIISFIEVKTLIDSQGFLPEDKVNLPKQKKILKTAENWLMGKKIPLDSKWQIDVVSIEIKSDSKKATVRHFQNAVF
jgi:putative endonuclease